MWLKELMEIIRGNTFLVFAIILVLGLFSTRLMKLLRLPNVTGYLLIGLLVGTFSSLFISSQIWMSIEKLKIGKDPNKHWYDDKTAKKEKEELQVKGINC